MIQKGSPQGYLSVVPSTIKLTNKQKEAPMDQPVIDNQYMERDKHYMTREFLESQLVQNKTRIDQLEEHIQKVTQRSYADSAERNRITEDMQAWTLKALEEGTINESEAEEIAEIVGFELTKEFELEVTVLYSVTVNARDEESAQNVIHDIDFDTVQYDSDNISWLSSSVDRIDI